jgi:trehalose/maltose transport system substrate-binding protein
MQRLGLSVFALLLFAAAPAGAQSLSISCGAIGVELQLCREAVSAWSEQTGVEVRVVSTPNSSTERLALYQQILAAGADDIDLFQVDVVWPGILANHLIDLAPYAGDAAGEHFATLIANNTIDGRLVALPWWTDAGVLYYRADLLEKHGREPPTTWQELTDTAAAIMQAERAAGDRDLWGYVWQGKAYEGLTCNALEWLDSFRAGRIVADDGKVTVANPRAVEAVRLAASWVGGISPEGVLNYDEEAARGVFQSGNAIFMRNWPYAWALANGAESPIRGRVGVTALPKGGPDGKTTGTLGGWNVAVSKYSAHPELAAELAVFLTSRAEQKRRAIQASYNPTLPALYKDQDVLAANPFFGKLYETFASAVARPSGVTGDKYNRVSAAFWGAVQSVLSGQSKAPEALRGLERKLERLGRRGRW